MKPTKEEVLKEIPNIAKKVFNSLRKSTTDKMILDLIDDYEDVIKKIIEETALKTIEHFDIKKVTEIMDDFDKKAREIGDRRVQDYLDKGGIHARTIIQKIFENEYNTAINRMLHLNKEGKKEG